VSTSTLGVEDLRSLAASWMLALRAERKSPQTLKNYGDRGAVLPAWCQQGSADPLARDSLRGWVAELVETAMAPATIRARQLPVCRFAAWLGSRTRSILVVGLAPEERAKRATNARKAYFVNLERESAKRRRGAASQRRALEELAEATQLLSLASAEASPVQPLRAADQAPSQRGVVR
jgi:hypothetical protein